MELNNTLADVKKRFTSPAIPDLFENVVHRAFQDNNFSVISTATMLPTWFHDEPKKQGGLTCEFSTKSLNCHGAHPQNGDSKYCFTPNPLCKFGATLSERFCPGMRMLSAYVYAAELVGTQEKTPRLLPGSPRIMMRNAQCDLFAIPEPGKEANAADLAAGWAQVATKVRCFVMTKETTSCTVRSCESNEKDDVRAKLEAFITSLGLPLAELVLGELSVSAQGTTLYKIYQLMRDMDLLGPLCNVDPAKIHKGIVFNASEIDYDQACNDVKEFCEWVALLACHPTNAALPKRFCSGNPRQRERGAALEKMLQSHRQGDIDVRNLRAAARELHAQLCDQPLFCFFVPHRDVFKTLASLTSKITKVEDKVQTLSFKIDNLITGIDKRDDKVDVSIIKKMAKLLHYGVGELTPCTLSTHDNDVAAPAAATSRPTTLAALTLAATTHRPPGWQQPTAPALTLAAATTTHPSPPVLAASAFQQPTP